MKIDWKKVSTSQGYQSLKATYITELQKNEIYKRKHKRKPVRSNKEFLEKFKWIINRAIHYAYHKNTTVDVILDTWENSRNYWWLNYYQNCNQPKLTRKFNRYLPPKEKIKSKKNRWTSETKKRAKEHKKLILKYNL